MIYSLHNSFAKSHEQYITKKEKKKWKKRWLNIKSIFLFFRFLISQAGKHKRSLELIEPVGNRHKEIGYQELDGQTGFYGAWIFRLFYLCCAWQ